MDFFVLNPSLNYFSFQKFINKINALMDKILFILRILKKFQTTVLNYMYVISNILNNLKMMSLNVKLNI